MSQVNIVDMLAKIVLKIFPNLFVFNPRFKSRNAKRRLSAIVPGTNQFTMIDIITAIFSAINLNIAAV